MKENFTFHAQTIYIETKKSKKKKGKKKDIYK